MMVLSKLTRLAILVAGFSALCAYSFAATVTSMSVAGDGTVSYSSAQREAWLKSGTQGFSVGDITGTPQATDVSTLFGGTWLKEGELTAVGTNDLLSVNLTSGSWGSGPLGGTWSIDSSFWFIYGQAVITMHVGNGAGNPDWFLWEISPNNTSGTFYYNRLSGGGGGLSNMFLWGSGPPVQVPDSGSSLVLICFGLVALGFFSRKSSRTP